MDDEVEIAGRPEPVIDAEACVVLALGAEAVAGFAVARPEPVLLLDPPAAPELKLQRRTAEGLSAFAAEDERARGSLGRERARYEGLKKVGCDEAAALLGNGATLPRWIRTISECCTKVEKRVVEVQGQLTALQGFSCHLQFKH